MNAFQARSWIAGLAVFLILISPAGAFPEIAGTVPADRPGKAYLDQAVRDCQGVVLSPVRWDGGDFLKLSAVLGTGLLLGFADAGIQDWMQKQRTAASENISKFFSHAGDGAYLSAFMAGLYLAGEAGGNPGLRRTALLSFESYLISGALVLGLKTLAGRARPAAGEGSCSFHPFSLKSSRQSLPSGHSISAWAVASVIADQMENAVLDAAVYSLAACASLSRVHDNKHWASDVFLGAALGYFIGKKICDLNGGEAGKRLKVSLELAGSRQCVTLSLGF